MSYKFYDLKSLKVEVPSKGRGKGRSRGRGRGKCANRSTKKMKPSIQEKEEISSSTVEEEPDKSFSEYKYVEGTVDETKGFGKSDSELEVIILLSSYHFKQIIQFSLNF